MLPPQYQHPTFQEPTFVMPQRPFVMGNPFMIALATSLVNLCVLLFIFTLSAGTGQHGKGAPKAAQQGLSRSLSLPVLKARQEQHSSLKAAVSNPAAAQSVSGQRSVHIGIFIVLTDLGGTKGYVSTPTEGTSSRSPWWLHSLRITRNANSHAPMYLLVSNATLQHPWLLQRLAGLRINVRLVEDYHNTPLCQRLIDAHGQYCIKDRGCSRNPVIYLRWCWIHQLAALERIERVLGVDADIPIYEDIHNFLSTYTEDLVTVMPYTSQFTLWNLKALNALNEFHIEFHGRSPEETKQLTQEHTLGRPFGDMETLNVFRAKHVSILSQRFLCKEHVWPCRDHRWQAVENMKQLGCWDRRIPACALAMCARVGSILTWANRTTEDGLVHLPMFNGTVLPAMHWQGADCKGTLATSAAYPFSLP